MINSSEGMSGPIRGLMVLIVAMTLASAAGASHSQQSWQYRWKVWLPANWKAVAQCETGTNFRHSNSSYVSAFGIQRGAFRGAYDSDAKRVGAPKWSDSHPPTPWQQYRTALSHYREFGDGWGCPGP